MICLTHYTSNPKGLEGSVTKGIVSSVRRGEGLLQIDAAISHGSSGGAVINRRAEVVGIVKSSIVEGQNLNFAVPVEYLESLSLSLGLPVIVAGACAYRDRDRYKLKGLVKSVAEQKERDRYVSTERRLGERGIFPSQTQVFDLDGNLIEQYIYTEVGARTIKLAMTYDENRFKTQVLTTAPDGNTQKQVLTPDESVDNKIWGRGFSGVQRLGTDEFQIYDREGNMVEWMLKNGKAAEHYTYEQDGRIKEKFIFEGSSITIMYRFSYKDDEQGNWIEMRELIHFPSKPEDGWSKGDVTYREIKYFH